MVPDTRPLGEAGRAMTPDELARRTGIPESRLTALLAALRSRPDVEAVRPDGPFAIGRSPPRSD